MSHGDTSGCVQVLSHGDTSGCVHASVSQSHQWMFLVNLGVCMVCVRMYECVHACIRACMSVCVRVYEIAYCDISECILCIHHRMNSCEIVSHETKFNFNYLHYGIIIFLEDAI